MYREIQIYNDLTHNASESPYGPSEDDFEAFWRTVIADNPLGTKTLDDYTYIFQEIDAVKKWVSHCRTNYDLICEIWTYRLNSRHILGPLLKNARADRDQRTAAQMSTEQAVGHGEAAILSPETVQCLSQYSETYTLAQAFKDLYNQADDPEWKHVDARREYCKHQLIKTKRGYLGLATQDVKPGDSLVILAGSASPWYLRREQEHYLIAGKGWVHGLMYRSDKYYQDGWKEGDIAEFELR